MGERGDHGDVPVRVIGIGASAGGVDALTRIVKHLPAGMSAAVCVVLHLPATGRSLLAPILDRRSEADVLIAEDGEPLRAGRVYVAPADRHLTIEEGRLRLDRGPKENCVRPAADPMLRSLAEAFGERAVAIVVSGALGDGTAGAVAVRAAGGTVIVQDPDDATVASMPESALRALGRAARVLTADEIGEEIARLGAEARRGERDVAMSPSSPRDAPGTTPEAPPTPPGPPSALTCPECHGPVWELKEGGGVHYRCRVGHAYSEDALLIEQGSAVESALWSALEALEERADFLLRMAARHGDARPRSRARCESAARDALERSRLIRSALTPGANGADALDVQIEAVE